MDPDEKNPAPWTAGQHLPPDARRLGLNANVPDGALLEFASSLDGAKPSHRIVAWVLLAAFLLPVVLTVLQLLR